MYFEWVGRTGVGLQFLQEKPHSVTGLAGFSCSTPFSNGEPHGCCSWHARIVLGDMDRLRGWREL